MLTVSDRYLYAGRLLNYLDNPQGAIEMFSEGIAQAPDDARLFRHRGHRYLTVRRYADAVSDLQHAANLIAGQADEHEFWQKETQDDIVRIILGKEAEISTLRLPVNEETVKATQGAYKSTLHGSIFYHLAIGHYLLGDFEAALDAFQRAQATSVDDDMRVANADWMYMTLRRLGRHAEADALIAQFDSDKANVNPDEDFYLRRLRMYKGQVAPEDLLADASVSPIGLTTQGYGVGNWYLTSGNAERAREIFKDVVAKGVKHAFAYMASEADLARI